MKVVFYGSCQLHAISKLIKIESEVILNWEYILSKKELPKTMYECDVFIYQPYCGSNEHKEYHTDTILKKLSKETKTISVPFMTTNIYWPDSITDIRNNETKSKTLLFGKFPQQSCILSKYTTLEEAIDDYESEHYNEDYMKNHAKNCLTKIKNAEENCDIKVFDYINTNISKHYPLFHSIQHPCNEILLHAAQQIYRKLEMSDIAVNRQELLKDHTVFILPCVQQALQIKVKEYKLNGNGIVDQDTYIKEYFLNINSQNIGFEFLIN